MDKYLSSRDRRVTHWPTALAPRQTPGRAGRRAGTIGVEQTGQWWTRTVLGKEGCHVQEGWEQDQVAAQAAHGEQGPEEVGRPAERRPPLSALRAQSGARPKPSCWRWTSYATSARAIATLRELAMP